MQTDTPNTSHRATGSTGAPQLRARHLFRRQTVAKGTAAEPCEERAQARPRGLEGKVEMYWGAGGRLGSPKVFGTQVQCSTGTPVAM